MRIGKKGVWELDTDSLNLKVKVSKDESLTAWNVINHALYILRLNKFWARTADNYTLRDGWAVIKMTDFKGDLDELPKEYILCK